MSGFSESYKLLLRDYTRPVIHMRHQFKNNRFGLVFGAGLSKNFKLPDWATLVESIAADSEVKGKIILKRFTKKGSLPYKTELLFQHFRKKQAEKYDGTKLRSLEFENKISARWLEICAKHLYENTYSTFLQMLKKHPYLLHLIPIVRSTPLTVTYNFDDFLERALNAKKMPDDRSRGFETVTNPWMQFRRPKGVVYHPNGVIPSTLMELPRDRFIFLESSFARQQFGTFAGDASFLVHHFCKNTCLIIGSSLEDETLRNVLIQSTQINPGNYHYYVHYLADGEKISQEDAEAIRLANFNVYNLITLFLNHSKIAALAKLINPQDIADDSLSDLSMQLEVPLKYCYYLTGALGVGKTTTTNQLRNLIVLDEWMEPRLEILAKPWDTLTTSEKRKADKWIANQFSLKNDRLRHDEMGIFVVDRPPLDPIAFTPLEEQKAKAQLLLKAICPENKWPIAEGVVILLKGEPSELSVRLLATGRAGYTADRLQKMQDELIAVYSCEGVIPLNTCGMSIPEVTKQVAYIIHFNEYKPCNLGKQFKRFL